MKYTSYRPRVNIRVTMDTGLAVREQTRVMKELWLGILSLGKYL